jgi:hypothetical protein
MQQTIQTLIAAVAALLAGAVVVGALAVLLLAEGYYIVAFGTRLYWRCRESMRQVRWDLEEPLPSSQDRPGELNRRPGSLHDGLRPHYGEDSRKQEDTNNHRHTDDDGDRP